MAGDDAVQFGLGEPDFQPPELAVEAFARAMREGRNKYTTTAGLPPLRKKIAEMCFIIAGTKEAFLERPFLFLPVLLTYLWLQLWRFFKPHRYWLLFYL